MMALRLRSCFCCTCGVGVRCEDGALRLAGPADLPAMVPQASQKFEFEFEF
jgi:hypothetical protein